MMVLTSEGCDTVPGQHSLRWHGLCARLFFGAASKKHGSKATNGHTGNHGASPRLAVYRNISSTANSGQSDQERKHLSDNPLDENKGIDPLVFGATVFGLNLKFVE